MKQPLVSVKMLTYNQGPYIAQAIEGVVMQKTRFPFELVIGEDCSTDGTREIVFDYAERYPEVIRVITSQANVGSKKNSQRVTQACRGKYVAYCEGDDYWHREDKLQLQVDYLESHPECGLVCSDYDVFHTETGERIHDFVKYRGWSIPRDISVRDFVQPGSGMTVAILTCTVVARSQLLEKLRSEDPYLYLSDAFRMGDTQLWAGVAHVSKIHFIDCSLATHLILPESAANSQDPIRKMKFKRSCSQLMSYLCEKYEIDGGLRQYYDRRANHYLLRIAFYERDLALAAEFRAKAPSMSLREAFLYYSIRSRTIHFVICSLLRLRAMLLKNSNSGVWH